MIIRLNKPDRNLNGIINLPASKSESNRAMIIGALCEDRCSITNLSNALDTKTMKALLKSSDDVLDVGPAGTVMRFMLAYLSLQDGRTTILTGSDRMKERPIGILVSALNALGAKITFLEKHGYPPVRIEGQNLYGGFIEIDPSQSSQFISALMMIGPYMKNGLKLKCKGSMISRPYIQMTAGIMEHFGIRVNWDGKVITIPQGKYVSKDFACEADWSAASYWYEMAAFSDHCQLALKGLRNNSLQGDSALTRMFECFGVKTEYINNGVILTRQNVGNDPRCFYYDFTDCPDLAQTLAVTCAGLDIPAHLLGLQSLRIKETDRLAALDLELSKLGYECKILNRSSFQVGSRMFRINDNAEIKTYHDHRMAMAFAPLAFRIQDVFIQNPDVVVKSYPRFWKDLESVGFEIHDVVAATS